MSQDTWPCLCCGGPIRIGWRLCDECLAEEKFEEQQAEVTAADRCPPRE